MKLYVPVVALLCAIVCSVSQANELDSLQYRFNNGAQTTVQLSGMPITDALNLAISYADLEAGQHTVSFRVVDGESTQSDWVSQAFTLSEAQVTNTLDGSSQLASVEARFASGDSALSIDEIDASTFIETFTLNLSDLGAAHYPLGFRAINAENGESEWVEQSLVITAGYVAAGGNPSTIVIDQADIALAQSGSEPVAQVITAQQPNYAVVLSAGVDMSDFEAGRFIFSATSTDSNQRESSVASQSAILKISPIVNQVDTAEYARNSQMDPTALSEPVVTILNGSPVSLISQTLNTNLMREARNELAYRGSDLLDTFSPFAVQAIQLPDNDDDNVQNLHDDFIDDPAAADDTDSDGSPDEWNPGKSQADSTTGLHLDDFITDPAASIDTDGDGFPDSWNPGKTQADSTTPLFLDAFPNDPFEWADFDEDGIGNNADTDDDNDGLPDIYEINQGLDPFDSSDAALDRDEDGLSNLDEFKRGTDIDNPDSDGDGILDGADNNPLVFDSLANQINRGIPLILADVNDDEVKDLMMVQLTSSGVIGVRIDGSTGARTPVLQWEAIFDASGLRPMLVPDLNQDGVEEVGLFGVRNDIGGEGRARFDVLNPVDGSILKRYNWPANWYAVSPLILSDINGDGVSDIGMQGRLKSTNRPQLIVRDGDSQRGLRTFAYPDLFNMPEFVQLSDVNGDGVDDIGLFGLKKNNNKVQIRVTDALSPSTRYRNFNYPDKWLDVSWHRLSDANGDGIDDWGLFGTLKEDGRKQLLNKRGNDPRGMLNVFTWPADLQDVEFARIKDVNFDTVDELAVSGLRGEDRYQIIAKNGVLRSENLVSIGWPNNWTDARILALPDFSGDDIGDFALLGKASSGNWELVIKDAVTREELGRLSLGPDWLDRPEVVGFDDVDGDDVTDLLIYGPLSGSAQSTTLQVVSGGTLETIW